MLTKVQLQACLKQHVEKENGINDIMEIMLEAMMVAERKEFLRSKDDGNKANGFRPGKSYGNGRILEFRVPRDRHGEFKPLLLAMLRSQEEECERLVGSLYTKGLTQSQVSEVFEQIYGAQYSKTSISRMLDGIREEVDQWMKRPLEKYYPLILIDAIHVKVRREDHVSMEAFYVVLGVTEERHREVLAIMDLPQESATGWKMLLHQICDRGVKKVGLMIADGLKGLDFALSEVFPGTPLQRCVTHLKRNLFAKVQKIHRSELADDLRDVFRTSDSSDDPEKGWTRWNQMCEKWGAKYKSFKLMKDNLDYRDYFTYLAYDYRVRGMIYTTNWIERLQRDFRRVLRMRGAIPGESVKVLMGKVAIDKSSYKRAIPKLNYEKQFFKGITVCEVTEETISREEFLIETL
jgi:putative transposase